ncbi:MAG: TIGR01906 family membrane protein [Anaerolineae bacterium]
MSDIPEQDKSKKDTTQIQQVAVTGLQLLLTVMIPFLLAVGSARLVMSPDFLAFEYNRPNFSPDIYGFTVEDRLNYGPYGVLYITNNEPLSYLADLELPGNLCFPPRNAPCQAFNPLELSHMRDVQMVAQRLFMVALWGGVLTVLSGVILARVVSIDALRLALMQGGLLTVGLIITIILLAVTAWDMFFTGFHSLFFEDGTWQFYYSDTLIRLYPEQFWFDASLLVGIMTTLGSVAILAVATRLHNNDIERQ